MSSSLSEADVRQMALEEIDAHKRDGIKFAIAGNAGYGKTTTLNTLFNTQMRTDPTKTATKLVHEVSMLIRNVPDIHLSNTTLKEVNLTVFDLPGLGDGEKDNTSTEEYFNIYTKLLPQVDVIMWILRADVRAFKLDIDYISRLINHTPSLKSKFLIGVNFVDAISPLDWDKAINQPSLEQENNLRDFLDNMHKIVQAQCGLEKNSVVPYSARQAWGLEKLFASLILTVPEGKRWVFADLKPDFREIFLARVPDKNRELVSKMYSYA